MSLHLLTQRRKPTRGKGTRSFYFILSSFYVPFGLFYFCVVNFFLSASPWLSDKNYECIRDDFSKIDTSYEITMERKRRALKLKPNQIGMIKKRIKKKKTRKRKKRRKKNQKKM